MNTEEIPRLEKRLSPNAVYDELTPKMKVALAILEFNDVDNKNAYFSGLVRELVKKVSRATIHKSLDPLLDQGAIRAEWVQIEKGHWVRGYWSASETQKKMLRRTYYASHAKT